MSWSIQKMVLVSALAGCLAGGFGVALLALVLPNRSCEVCGSKMPRFRRPTNRHEMLWGGYTCAECGVKLDRQGRVIPSI
jgi:hypothetical protein